MTTDQASDTYYADSPTLRSFITEVQRVVAQEPECAKTVQALREPFGALLRDTQWLPEAFMNPDSESGMGAGIGNYLLFRSAARDLTLISLVLPPGGSTPVHDHLAWGLVGLYAGEQREWVYQRVDGEGSEGTAELEEVERRRLSPGDFYDLLPPEGDIHRVESLGEVPSVSIHLLGSDIGCTWRHRFELHEHRVLPFRSSYSNEPCEDEG
jgi:3-mercaptopropionate dioxygenase